MNVLALYDIHGNVDALEAVLADPRARDADVVLVGGDAVPGPFARATLDRLERARRSRSTGSAATASARWPRRSTAPAPADDDLAARHGGDHRRRARRRRGARARRRCR